MIRASFICQNPTEEETAQQVEKESSSKQDQKDEKKCVQSFHFQKWNKFWTPSSGL
jgi:hypothetical protein